MAQERLVWSKYNLNHDYLKESDMRNRATLLAVLRRDLATKATPVAGHFERSLVVWVKRADPLFPYETKIGALTYLLRLNNFPDESLATVVTPEGREILEVDNFLSNWVMSEEQNFIPRVQFKQ